MLMALAVAALCPLRALPIFFPSFSCRGRIYLLTAARLLRACHCREQIGSGSCWRWEAPHGYRDEGRKSVELLEWRQHQG